MDKLLTQLGLSEKEAAFYLYLLSEGSLTAAQISKANQESRTNTYMILDRLLAEQIVTTDNESAVKRFSAADPNKLRELLNNQLLQVRQSQSALNTALPQLSSLFSLGNHKPGIVYLTGLSGFRLLLEDMAKTKDVVDLIASDIAHENKEAWVILQKGIAKRKARGIKTRAIFHKEAQEWPHIAEIAARGFELRFWGEQPLEGELVLYDQKIALTVYKPTLIVTVITNEVLAKTFRAIFEEMWSQAIH